MRTLANPLTHILTSPLSPLSFYHSHYISVGDAAVAGRRRVDRKRAWHRLTHLSSHIIISSFFSSLSLHFSCKRCGCRATTSRPRVCWACQCDAHTYSTLTSLLSNSLFPYFSSRRCGCRATTSQLRVCWACLCGAPLRQGGGGVFHGKGAFSARHLIASLVGSASALVTFIYVFCCAAL
jgi:hypothetical protein